MEVALGAIVKLVTILVALFPWWSGEATRIGQACARQSRTSTSTWAATEGAGNGSSLTSRTEATGRRSISRRSYQAFRDLHGPRNDASHENVTPQVPVEHARIRRELVPNATVSLICEDRLGLQHRITPSLTQTRRDDGAYSFGSGGAPTVVRPTLGFREIWRLRRRA